MREPQLRAVRTDKDGQKMQWRLWLFLIVAAALLMLNAVGIVTGVFVFPL